MPEVACGRPDAITAGAWARAGRASETPEASVVLMKARRLVMRGLPLCAGDSLRRMLQPGNGKPASAESDEPDENPTRASASNPGQRALRKGGSPMQIDFKALVAGLGAAAVMAFGAHAHPHKHHPHQASQKKSAPQAQTKAPQAAGASAS